MLTYPMLNDRPIDQWMVTELKDELQRRSLPVSGLKDDLVQRLFEAIQDKVLDGGEKTSSGTTTPEELKGGEIPGSVDASVNEASIEEHIDEGSSEVTKQGADLAISVTEAYDESILATSEVTQEAVIGTAEASQRSLDAVVEVESSLVDTAATDETNGNDLESASNGNTRVDEAACSDDNGNTIDKIPEDDTNEKKAVDDVPSDVTGADIKLGLNMHGKVIEMEDVSAPPDDNVLHGDHEDADAVATAEPEDDTSMKMTIELSVKVVCKTEQEEVPALPDAIGEIILATSEVTQEAAAGTAEASQRSLDAVAEVESSLVSMSAMKTNGNGLESASSGNIVLEEANPRSDDHGDTIEKTPEDDTNKKMAVDDVPSDVTGGDIKLGLNMHEKILEMEAPDDIVLHGDHEDAVAVATAEPEDDTSKKMTIELSVKVDCKTEQEEVPALPDAIGESILATSEVTQEAAAGTAEASQRSLDAVAEVESSLVSMSEMKTNGNGLESASSGNIVVDEANPHSDDHGDTMEKTPEDDTNKKMAVEDVPSDVSGGDIKLGLNMNGKILEMEDVSALPDDIVLHGDHEDTVALATAEPIDDTSKKMAIELSVKVDCKTEQEEVLALPDAIDESILATSEVTQEPAVGTAEGGQRSLDAVAEVESSLVNTSAMETNGNGLESASSGNIIVEEANPHSEDHGDTIEKTPEDDTNKKMDVVTGGDIKLGLNMHRKILEKKDVTAPLDDIVLDGDHEDADAIAAAGPEDNTSNKMATDDLLSDVTHTTVKLGIKADCKIEEEEVPTLPDGIGLHADPKEADVVAAAENMIPKDSFSVNTLMYGNGHGDSKCSDGYTKPFLCREKDQASEVNPDLDAQIKCVSVFDDNISTNENNDVKGNLNADDCDLELEAKQEMVKPSSTIISPGDHLQVLDVEKGLHKNGTSLQELCSTSNIDLDREKESLDGSSREKLNFDRSSGDESMDEDLTDSKHADSNIKSDDLGEKTEVTSENVLKEVSLLDTAAEGSSAHTKEVVAEEKLPSPAEKRKPEDRGVIANKEPIKRQRLCKVDAVGISDHQASKLTGTGTPKEVFHSALKHSFGRPGTTASRDYPKERIVPPARNPATTSLRIDRFVRPFTLKAVQELLGKTGSVSSFWMDHIKTHCYVTYSSVEEAVSTRNAVYNLQWPPNNHSYLVAEFVDPQEVKLKLEAPPPSQALISPSTATAPQAVPSQQPNANQMLPPPPAALLPTPVPHFKLLPASGPGPAREMLPPPPPRNLEPARTLDDLFKKTQAYPRIYYMPLSDEEVSTKLAARNNGKRG